MSSPSSLASSAFALLVGDHPEEAIDLVMALVAAGRLKPSDSVRVPSHQHTVPAREMPLTEAVRSEMSPGHLSRVHTPAMAIGIRALDASFFNPPDQPTWLWDYLVGWSTTEFERYGFRASRFEQDTRTADHWAAEVIAHLPDAVLEHKAADAGWAALIRMGFSRSMAAFVARKPQQVLARNEKGALALARAKEAWALDVVLVAGEHVDVWALQDDGRPLWRHLAPKTPTSIPDKGSLTEAVERWAAGGADGGRPDRRSALDRFLRESLRARMAHRSWREYASKDRREYLDGLPLSWVADGWPTNGKNLPLWAQPFLVQRSEKDKNGRSGLVSEAAAWARALQERPMLREAIGPLADLAIWLVLHGRSAADAEASDDVVEAARHPDARDLFEGLLQGLPPAYGVQGTFAAQGEALLLKAQLPEAAATARRHRL